MARSLDAIIQELDAGYNPSRQLINERIAAIPAQADAEVAGLQAQLGQANNDILANAQSRGLGFSGIPVAEQAKYAAGTFAPAVARVRQASTDQKTSLLEALNNTNLEQRKYATSIQQNEFNLDEQRRQFEEAQKAAREAEARSRAAAAGYGGGYLGGGGDAGVSAGGAGQGGYSQRADKGFAFTNQYGNPISAAQYAALKGVPFRQLLGVMARAGDKGAEQALTFVGDDYGYDSKKLTSPALASLYNSLVWGVRPAVAAPIASANPALSKNISGALTQGISNPVLGRR